MPARLSLFCGDSGVRLVQSTLGKEREGIPFTVNVKLIDLLCVVCRATILVAWLFVLSAFGIWARAIVAIILKQKPSDVYCLSALFIHPFFSMPFVSDYAHYHLVFSQLDNGRNDGMDEIHNWSPNAQHCTKNRW